MNAQPNSALFGLSGEVSNNASWSEDIYFLESGSGTILTGLSFQFQFRKNPDSTSTDLVLSTAGGDLTIVNDSNGQATVLRIDVPYTRISAMEGDYRADLVSKDVNNKLTHWASGLVSFVKSPVAF